MPAILSLSTSLPPHVISQEQAVEGCRRIYSGREDLLPLTRVFTSCGVRRRHFAFPPEYYLKERSFTERNRDYVEKALELALNAASDSLRKASVDPRKIDHLLVVTTTGLATPSLDALLVARLGLRADVRRWPLFGLGCAGGAGALIRAADLVGPSPGQHALVVAVELCGQVFSQKALTPTDVIGVALFGDGAAAAVVGPGPGPGILSARTRLYEGTEHLMGWDFTSDGMRLRLSKEVTDFVGDKLRPVVEQFLGDSSVRQDQVAHWILHPGGRRIIETYQESFGLGEPALRWTRESLARVGNLSSASVLFVLGDLLASGVARPGDRGLLCALGPGFASELMLLGW